MTGGFDTIPCEDSATISSMPGSRRAAVDTLAKASFTAPPRHSSSPSELAELPAGPEEKRQAKPPHIVPHHHRVGSSDPSSGDRFEQRVAKMPKLKRGRRKSFKVQMVFIHLFCIFSLHSICSYRKSNQNHGTNLA
jgi:hypothetical protein